MTSVLVQVFMGPKVEECSVRRSRKRNPCRNVGHGVRVKQTYTVPITENRTK